MAVLPNIHLKLVIWGSRKKLHSPRFSPPKNDGRFTTSKFRIFHLHEGFAIFLGRILTFGVRVHQTIFHQQTPSYEYIRNYWNRFQKYREGKIPTNVPYLKVRASAHLKIDRVGGFSPTQLKKM